MNGVVIYRGPSKIDGKNIICVATGIGNKSENRKTGEVIQTWILRADNDPITACRLGYDYSICGDCKHRHFGTCYVNLLHGPQNVYRSDCLRKYSEFNHNDHIELFRNKFIRMGSYGDPVAVPIEVWQNILSVSKGFSGYTHQWKKCNQEFKNYVMASVELDKEYHQAKKMGWRTFRVVLPGEDVFRDKGETLCRASDEFKAIYGFKITCEQCGLCCGNKRDSQDIAIYFHSNGVEDYRKKRYIKGIKAMTNKKAWKKDFRQNRKNFQTLCKL